MNDRPSFDDDAAAPRMAWLRRHAAELAEVPLPGSGATAERWRALADLGTSDGSLARLAEGHLDAQAIRAELGVPDVGAAAIQAVWAARPERLIASPARGGWRLHGDKPWCSGADAIDRALVTATDPDGAVRLFDVDVRSLDFADDWHPMGMVGSDSRTACVDTDVPRTDELGGPGCYTDRPGFWHGGAGVAACWHGLARRLALDLADHAAAADSPHLSAARGEAAAMAAAASALLATAARQVDADSGDLAAARARTGLVRLAVERHARAVLAASTSAQGAAALCFDARHARAVADLTVYLGQHHHGVDAAHVEALPDDAWWST